jgi:ABC-type multidrug transport system permease subunit
MIWTLLRKDAARVCRNPWGLLLSLAIPLMVTGLVGSIFGPKSKSGGVPTIRLAIVDEDQSVLGSVMMGALNREHEGRRVFEALAHSRTEAERLIRDNQISAVIILPEGFSESFLRGERPAPIELIKNPAQVFLPLITEELMSVVVEVLDAASKNLGDDMQGFVQELEEEDMPDFVLVARSIEKIGRKFEAAEEILFPPLITFGVEERVKKTNKAKKTDTKSGKTNKTNKNKKDSNKSDFSIFGFLLPGLAAMFLLFIADAATQEIFRERESGLLDRIRSYNHNIFPVLISKSAYALVLLFVSGGILFGAGSAIFGIRWGHPLELLVLVICYSVFAVGLVSLIAAFMKTQKRAAILNNMIIMLISFLGGGLIQANDLPAVIALNVSPWLPNFWFAEAIKSLEYGTLGPHWGWVAIKLATTGAILLAIATRMFNRLLSGGNRP